MMRSGDFPQIVAPTMYASGGEVPSWLQPARRDTGPADYDGWIPAESRRDAYSPPPPQRDDPLNGELNRGAMTAKEYAAKRPKLRDPQLKARGGKIHPAIHHHIAHALIKLAEGGTVDLDAHEAAHSPYNELPEPTERQRSVGNYKKGKTNINGLHVSIENPAGSKRRPEWPELQAHYGYATGGTPSSDGDHVDVFVKPGTALDHDGPVHVIDQIHPNGTFDEVKAMVGWPDKKSALEGYNANYSKDWKGAGAMTSMAHDKFKDWVRDSVKSAPVARKSFSRSEGGDYLCKGGSA